ncbi:acyl carrier protein [Spiroplasma endosymbiont of Amphibalanus improvisus]|uniref:acyl carrier protein n=1 Tax=Spiroplasma endosymbiont of Amphibalanus improvisus TaxID=3066327 RepID=UPI00313D3576
MEDKMLKELQKILKAKNVKIEINENTTFKDIGLDSLDLMDLIILLEEKFDINIPDEDLMNLKNVNDLMKKIKELQK